MTFWGYAGVIIAVLIMIWLFKTGYEGYYLEEIGINIVLQAFFIAAFCLAAWGFGRFRKEVIYAAVVLSFAGPFLGSVMEWRKRKRPVRHLKEESQKRKLNSLIANGRKYKAYSDFLRNYADRIVAISSDGAVKYAPAGVNPFSKKDNGYEVTTEWNPELGHPVFYFGPARKYKWEMQSFFKIEEGERNWTFDETKEIEKLVEQSLPGGRGNWDYTNEYKWYYRKLPPVYRKKNRKDPY